jgi:predicted SnoaL-like aldol condensation-catalyzing enzyme
LAIVWSFDTLRGTAGADSESPIMKRILLSLMPALLFWSTAVEGMAHETNAMKPAAAAEARKSAFRRVVEMWETGRVDLITQLVTTDYVGHPTSGDRNTDGLRKRMTEFHALYPDIKFTIEDQVAEGDRVATRMTAVGTSSVTGQQAKLTGFNISRFVGNRIAEEWPVWEAPR